MINTRRQGPALVGLSTKVGRLTVADPRAKWARVELDGVDVTRGYGPKRYKVLAANDVEGWIHYMTPERFTAFVRGRVRIFLNTPSDDALARTDDAQARPS